MRRFLRALCLGLLALGVSAGAAAAADGLSAPKLDAPISGEPAAEPVLEPVTQPVADAVEPIVEAAEPVLEPVTQPVGDAVEPIVEAAEPVLEPVTQPVGDAVEPIVEVADPVLEPVRPIIDALDPILEVGDPVIEPMRPIIDGVGPIAEVADPLLEPYNPYPLPGAAAQPLTDDPPRLVPDPGTSSSPTLPQPWVDAGSVAKTTTPQSSVPIAVPSLTRLIDLPPPFSRSQVAQMAGITLAIGGALWVALFGLGLLAPPFRAGRRPWVGPLLLRGLVPIPVVPPG